jgi:hypothetical protein
MFNNEDICSLTAGICNKREKCTITEWTEYGKQSGGFAENLAENYFKFLLKSNFQVIYLQFAPPPGETGCCLKTSGNSPGACWIYGSTDGINRTPYHDQTSFADAFISIIDTMSNGADMIMIRITEFPKIDIIPSKTKYYRIAGAILSKGLDHVVAGIVCDDAKFIYDSNDIFESLDWTKTENIKTTYESYYMKALFYVRKDFIHT